MVEKVPFPSLRAALVDPRTGNMVAPWNSFFQNLFELLNNSLLGPFLQGLIDSDIDIPFANDCAVRVASKGNLTELGVAYVNNQSNNGLWVYDAGEGIWRYGRLDPGTGGITVDTQNCVIDGVSGQAVVGGLQYNIFLYFANSGDRYLACELSLQPGIYGNTFLNDHGILVKGPIIAPDLTRRYIGTVFPDLNVPPRIWNAGTFGVFQDHISSYYCRQRLTSQITLTGSVAPPTNVWKFPSAEFISTSIWDDGDDFQGGCFGSVKTTNAPDIVYVGITRNQAVPPPPGSVCPVYCAVANQPYPFFIEIPGGSVGTQVYRLDLALRSASGLGTISIHNDAICDGAGMTMNYTH